MVRRTCFKIKAEWDFYQLLNILDDFLRNRKQRVVLNEQTFNWENIHAGIPEDSILDHCFS